MNINNSDHLLYKESVFGPAPDTAGHMKAHRVNQDTSGYIQVYRVTSIYP